MTEKPTTPEETVLSYSRLSAWKSCHYNYDLRYTRRIYPRKRASYLSVGSLIHKGIEHGIRVYHETGNAVPDLASIWEVVNAEADRFEGKTELSTEEYEEAVNDSVDIAHRALETLDLSRFEIPELDGKPTIELELTIPFEGWKGFVAVIDLVVRDKETGYLWILDFKSRKQFQSFEQVEMSLQFPIYQKILAHHGLPIVGVMDFQIKRTVPAIPKLNKNGTMSKAKIATDWGTYKDALESCGLDPNDYLDMQEKLTTEFFRFTRHYRSMSIVDAIWEEVVKETAKDLHRYHSGESKPYRAFNVLNTGCSSCKSYGFCTEELYQGDAEYLLDNLYEKKEPRK